MTMPADVINVARRYLGVKESPAGSNRTQFGAFYGVQGQPWCAIFASFCLYVAGYRFPDATTGKGFSYCPSIVAWGKQHGRISRTPHVGDLAVAVDGPRPHHVELVTHYAGGPMFTSIGGNTGPADLSNGGEVLEHDHPVGSAWVFVTPYYTAPASTTRALPGPAARPHLAGRPAPAKAGPNPVHRNLALTTPATTGRDVTWIQQRLAAHHLYRGKIDGQYGPMTHDAVVAFQRQAGLTRDGICGPVTADHLSR